MAEYFGADPNTLRARNISYSNLPEEWKKDEVGFCKAYYDRVVADTPFKAWGVAKLRELGHIIVIIIGRTHAFYTDPYKTTEAELANGGIEYDRLICTLDKASACVAEKISVLIDNLPANCAAAEREGISALVFSSKANKDEKTSCTRVDNWAEAVEAMKQLEQRKIRQSSVF